MSAWNIGGSGRVLRLKGGFYNSPIPILQCEANGNYGDNVRLVVMASGNVGVGTDNPGYKLHLADGDFVISNSGTNNFKIDKNGNVTARQVDVTLNAIPDFVFKTDYKLMPIKELEIYVTKFHHLPIIKSEAEYKKAGSVDIGELNIQLLQKMEEMTLYVIQLQKQIDELNAKIAVLQSH